MAKKPKVGTNRGIVGSGTADKFGRTPAQQKSNAHDNGFLGKAQKGNARKTISPTHGIIRGVKGS
jgi:hypothetical protein